MNITDLNGIVIVTGTDTDVGKTVTTAVIASALKQSGKDVTIIKRTRPVWITMSLATFTMLDGSPALTPTTCWSTCAAPNRWPRPRRLPELV